MNDLEFGTVKLHLKEIMHERDISNETVISC